MVKQSLNDHKTLAKNCTTIIKALELNRLGTHAHLSAKSVGEFLGIKKPRLASVF
jgi:hypothetical protein